MEMELTEQELAEVASLKPEDDRCVVGKCPYCWKICNDLLPTEKGCDYPLRCAECDTEYTWCSVCDEEQPNDDHCRHIFRDAGDYEWYGSGSYGVADADIKRSFLRLVRLMPQGFAVGLRSAILSGKFYTFAVMPMIGSGGHIELNGFEAFQLAWDWGYEMVRVGHGDAAESAANGYSWLASLYKNDTAEANRITVAWLEEWLASRTGRQLNAPTERRLIRCRFFPDTTAYR